MFNLTNTTIAYNSITGKDILNDSLDSLKVSSYIIATAAVSYILIFLLGCIGNSLVMFVVIRNRSLHQTTNYCLVNLSICDLLLLCICMPTAFTELFSEEIWNLGWFLCKFTNWLEHTVVNAEVLTILSICIERYRAISNPLSMRQIPNKMFSLVIILTWLISGSAALPFYWITSFYESNHRKYIKTVHICVNEFRYEWQRGYLIAINISFYILPCIIMISLYSGIIFIIKKQKFYKLTAELNDRGSARQTYTYTNQSRIYSLRKTLSTNSVRSCKKNSKKTTFIELKTINGSEKDDEIQKTISTTAISMTENESSTLKRMKLLKKMNHNQTTLMIFAMIIAFFVLLLPYRIFAMWIVHVRNEQIQNLGIEKYNIIIASIRVVFYINSAINPILYHFLSSKFKTAFKNVIYCNKRASNRLSQKNYNYN